MVIFVFHRSFCMTFDFGAFFVLVFMLKNESSDTSDCNVTLVQVLDDSELLKQTGNFEFERLRQFC